MKNQYLMKVLCIAVAMSMLTSQASMVTAESESSADNIQTIEYQPTIVPTPSPADTSSGGDVSGSSESGSDGDMNLTPTPGPVVEPSPTVTPENPDESSTNGDEGNQNPDTGEDPSVTPTPGETDPTLTPDPSETPTPTPEETPTPTPIPEGITKLIERITALEAQEKITLEMEAEFQAIRKEYDLLTEEEKALITNYPSFEKMEKEFQELKEAELKKKLAESYVSNIHAGNEFYLASLEDSYQLSFDADFASIMNQIEQEYQTKKELKDRSNSAGFTSTSDNYLVRNWQDILAIYVYQQHLQGKKNYHLDKTSKEELAEIFEMMNPVLTDGVKTLYADYHIEDYMAEHEVDEDGEKFLKKYVTSECKLLCAIVTASKGFVRQSLGEKVAEERVNVVAAGYSAIGKVGYFWGGKSYAIGFDSSWGTPTTVISEGSRTTGTVRSYGLDCSGFVTWAIINGYMNTDMGGAIGCGTSDQWYHCYDITEAQAQPGDLVFFRGPESGSDNHIGIICAQADDGSWLVVHCSSSRNGVTVGEAYSTGFRLIRQPVFYPAQSYVDEIIKEREMFVPITEMAPEIDIDEWWFGDLPEEEMAEEIDASEFMPEMAEEIDMDTLGADAEDTDAEGSNTEEADVDGAVAEDSDANVEGSDAEAESGNEGNDQKETESSDDKQISGNGTIHAVVLPDHDTNGSKEVEFSMDALLADLNAWDDFTLKPEPEDKLPDSGSEFFVGPLKPAVVPIFGPVQSSLPYLFGPSVPYEILLKQEMPELIAEEFVLE